jgi:multimeric flavodoxin WrbA
MENIRVLGICGSPRKGNSYFLLEKALEGAKATNPNKVQTTLYSFKGKTMNPCIGDNSCAEKGGVCIHDDDFEEIRGPWMEANAIIYSVPVYHMTYPGQLKCFIDRLGNSMFGVFRSYWPAGKEFDSLPKMYKVIGSIAQGCHIFSGQEHTLTDLVNHAMLMQCIPIPGDMWEAYIGVGGWTSNEIDRESLKTQAEKGYFDASAAVKASGALGRRVVEVAAVTLSGLLQNKDILKDQPIYKPLFNWLEGKDWGENLPWRK